MKVWLKRQGHRVGGRLPGASKSAVTGQRVWQQDEGVGAVLHGGEVSEEHCDCEQVGGPVANHSVGEGGLAVYADATAPCECEHEMEASDGEVRNIRSVEPRYPPA